MIELSSPGTPLAKFLIKLWKGARPLRCPYPMLGMVETANFYYFPNLG
ncbi:hypothetical protein D082_22090 [Synechocystis sp. PCC 6714]|nr:hypothetical protein D082_22090 [Synechocystis sp. PCC 6714]